MKHRSALILLFACGLLALACNLPILTAPAGPSVKQSVLETLAALSTLTPPAGSPVEVAPHEGPADLGPLPIVTVAGAPTQNQPQAGGQATPVLPGTVLQGDTYQYMVHSGDTLAALALRFAVEPAQIRDAQGSMLQYPPEALLPPGQTIIIPNTLNQVTDGTEIMPDSEVVYSPSAVGFSVADFVQQAGGYLSTYSEDVEGQKLTGAQVIQRVADETSTNPRLLLAVLEYRSHWVFSSPADGSNPQYPIGFYADQYSGLYKEVTLASRQLTLGYYGWRSGKGTDLTFANGAHLRVNPSVNPGTAALDYLFSKLYEPADWQAQLYSPAQFPAFYREKFGDPWQRDAAVEPLLPAGLTQPPMQLPFVMGQSWSLTGGPHAAWGVGSPWGGLDFAPAGVEKGCTVSRFLATAAAGGLVTRSGNGQVMIDLDGDGHEQTGWVLLYLHMADQERAAVGTQLKTNDPVGHPSCVGGFATGTHAHIARKYNGEWLAADGPLPFVLSGWQAASGTRQYSGTLTRQGQVVNARPDGASTSLVTR